LNWDSHSAHVRSSPNIWFSVWLMLCSNGANASEIVIWRSESSTVSGTPAHIDTADRLRNSLRTLSVNASNHSLWYVATESDPLSLTRRNISIGLYRTSNNLLGI
jgi:hypothetical protein